MMIEGSVAVILKHAGSWYFSAGLGPWFGNGLGTHAHEIARRISPASQF
jgi:hypothetical protein